LAGTASNTEETSSAEASNLDTSASASDASTPATSTSESASEDNTPSEASDEENTTFELPDEDNATPEVKMPKVPSKKRKREGESREELRKRRREQQNPPGKLVIREGPEEPELDEHAKAQAEVWKRIEHEVKVEIKTRERRGEFAIGAGKRAKYNAGQLLRSAKKEVKRQLVADAMMSGDLDNPKNYTHEEALANYERDMKAKEKEERKKNRLKKEARTAAFEAVKMESKAAKSDRRKARMEEKANAKADAEHAAKELDLLKHEAQISKKIAKLSPEKKAEYEERAALKSQSLEEYVLRRIQKKSDQKNSDSTPAETPAEASTEAPPLFFTDLEGDKNILSQTAPASKPIEPEQPTYTRNPDGSLPLDPAIWTGRQVKTLTKEEREARRLWLAKRREDRKAASGKAPINGEKGPTRTQLKMKRIEELKWQQLRDMGVQGEPTQEQKNDARRAARRVVKEEKKEKKREGKGPKLGKGKKKRTGNGRNN
jgi:hypothetical protein